MDIYKKINKLFRNMETPKMQFYQSIGMTASGFNKMIEQKSIKIDTLEKIANFFEKPLGYFFDDYNTELSLVFEPETPYQSDLYKNKYIDCLEKNIELLKRIEELNNLLGKK